MIKYGESKIDKIMFGEQMVNKVMYGESLILQYISAPKYWFKATTYEPNQEVEFRFIDSYTTTKITSDENSEIILGFDSEYYNPNSVSTRNMFKDCIYLTALDLSNFDTSKVTNMSSMFDRCQLLTFLNVTNFNTSKVTNMAYMFYDCLHLTSLDLSNFDTSNVTSMRSMFETTRLTSLDLSNFDTSNVTSMRSMFENTRLTSLDLSNFDTSNVTNMNYMFRDCSYLSHIKCKQALKDWCIANQDIIFLPDAMREGGSGIWEIIG